MSVVKWVAVAGLAVSGSAVGCASNADVRDTKGELRAMETRVAQNRRRQLALPQITAVELSEVTATARSFAKDVSGGKDAAFVQAFRDALSTGIESKLLNRAEVDAGAADVRRSRAVASSMRTMRAAAESEPDSIQDDPQVVQNSVALINTPDRILGGVSDRDNEFPDCVAIGSDEEWACSGTLVSPNVVITAGHCYPNFAKQVFIGSSIFGRGEVIAVKRAVRHPDYGKGGRHNDITVLLLEREVTSVKPRRIAPSGTIDQATNARLVGYGTTNSMGSTGFGIRRKVDIPLASTNCRGLSDSVRARYGCDEDLELVAADPLARIDTCRGDSGGSLLVEVEGEWMLAGITSRATRETMNSGRLCGGGGIYGRADRYEAWIRSIPGGIWSERKGDAGLTDPGPR
jgi:hypothetical protein